MLRVFSARPGEKKNQRSNSLLNLFKKMEVQGRGNEKEHQD